MVWNEDKIKEFEKALEGPSPSWDPEWEITEQLLKLVTMQARQMMYLQKQVDILRHSHLTSTETLIYALQQNMAMRSLNDRSLTQEEVHNAIQELNQSIEAAARGEKAVKYAGNILRFVARIII